MKGKFPLLAIITFLVPLIFSTVALSIIKGDKTPEVVKLPAAYGKGTGYESRPAEYTVTASPSYRWKQCSITLLVVLGYIVFGVGAIYIAAVDPAPGKALLLLAATWIIGLLLIFTNYEVKYYSNTYSKTISEQQYNDNKNNLDVIFEQ